MWLEAFFLGLRGNFREDAQAEGGGGASNEVADDFDRLQHDGLQRVRDVAEQARRAAIPLSRHTLRKPFRTACRVRLQTLTIHHGRHSFISHALAGGRTLAEVRDAAGHANVSITSGYLHIAVDDDQVGALFDFESP